ncbi:hypothetical protein MATL_G00126120 [Megalops atlanticus]|uniref:IgGFc-binding protein n=1 Tax=Megalops atlanticus TaxID=7932 RepID=A0A9D3PX20_MEGAT|nr:hypothetical protein MATL_G00126120 [Megalops atlanticus]
MGTKVLLPFVVALLLCGLCHAGSAGREFATVFMENYKSSYRGEKFQIQISALHANTKVKVSVPHLNFVQERTLGAGQGVTIPIDRRVEICSSQKSSKTVLIEATKDVTVASFNYKPYTADTSVIHPVSEWGTEYFIYTPPISPGGMSSEFAVTNHKETNTVQIFPRKLIRFEGRVYYPGSTITVTLKPFESLLLQSQYDLTGTRVASKLPVAVTTGHTCTWRFSRCNHVYEQLAPVNKWGKSFIVAPLSFQSQFDTVSIQASQPTQVNVNSGNKVMQLHMQGGQSFDLQTTSNNAIYITANQGIQVLFLFNGAKISGGYYDPFLTTILPMDSFCTSYTLNGQDGFKNMAIFLVRTGDVPGFRFDNVPAPKNLQWKTVAGTEFSWAEMSYQGGAGRHSAAHPSSPIGVYSIGFCSMNAYGSPALCGQSELSCDSITCSADEECKMEGGTPTCVKKKPSGTCWAQGDPHYRTFDGRRFDFMGTCSYTIAKNCKADDGLPPFEVETQNENRGNIRVSYVGLVTVKVYGVTIHVARSETGRVRIDYGLYNLPVVIGEGKVRLFQKGWSAIIETDFGLKVQYDWESYVVVTVSGDFAGKVCGMCGNFNGNPKDDFATPGGTQAPNAVDFGRSWKVAGLVSSAACRDDCQGQCERCQHNLLKKWEGELFCGLLTRIEEGPFRLCHAVIDPRIYVDNCLYDVCMADGLRHFLCRALEAYADACQNAGIQVFDWRVIARCPAKCPENSHYELCGSACPATCADPSAPSKCKAACVETCTCNDGFVLSGGKCVPTSRCGCSYQGRHIAPGESVWADNSCNKRCTCNAGNSQLECKDTGCKKGEQCMVVDGIRNCHPVSYSNCAGTGDPHYRSFDGRRYDFQGTCVYQLVALCAKDPNLVPFEVLVQNDHRGSKVVSYTRLVEIKVFGMNIVISKRTPGKILINGELTNLPVQLEDGQVSIYKSGWFAVVETGFGLKVLFNWNSAVFVKLASTYAGAVCGLCGNYNKNGGDDLTMKDGKVAATPAEFGSSWRVEEIPGCVHGCKGVCPDCDVTQKRLYESDEFCGIMRDPKGPFRECHAKVDPAGYFEDCSYDVCLYKGRKDVLCQAITAYTSACQDIGANVYPWRSETFCYNKCPANSHYEVCATGCPATCQSLGPPAGCKALCKEGCACDDGFILSGDDCVPFSQCGCQYNNRYYSIGEVFYPGGKCDEECKCGQDGQVECKKFTCGPYEKCEVVDGVRKCQPIGKGVCSASGDPHYKSFDGLRFDFQGTCTYTLAKGCGLEGTHLVPFAVQVENESWKNVWPGSKVSVTKLVAVEVFGYTLIMRENMFGMLVNGVFNNLPVNLNNGAVVAYQDGAHYTIETNSGLVVTYDLVYHVTVTVPGNYRGKTCGLCGNFNENKNDDYRLASGAVTSNVNTFGASWKVAIPGVVCDDGCAGNDCPKCDAKLKAVFQQPGYCGILTDPKGPFAACHAKLDPVPYFNDCIYDICVSQGDRKVLCDNVAAYVFNCQVAGVEIKSWRTASFCPMSCPANSHYEICTDSCETACEGLTEIAKCSSTCTEGCSCDAGFVFNGQTCVESSQCGCFANGHTYKPGQVVFENECTQKCTCDAVKGLICENHTCPGGTKCLVRKGVKACFNTDPCKDAKCRVKETCRVEKDEAVCVPQYTGTCWAYGDPHYHTFDGYNFDFQGTCKYTISKTCGDLAGLVPFSVQERNDNRGSTAVSFVREVEVSVYGFTFVVTKYQYGRIMVNNEMVNLPFEALRGQVRVTQEGNMAVLQTDFGLRVSYNWNDYIIIQLPSSYYDSVCGLCGNFNGNPGDELRNPAGQPVSSVADWGKSWRVADQEDPLCWDTCKKDCPNCKGDDIKLYQTEAYCGALVAKVNGIFQKCHAKVDPQAFMNSCVYDVCMNNGDRKMLCKSLASYSDMCRKEGIVLDDWRTRFNCPMSCQPNSHYEACTSPCPVSCPFPDAKLACEGTCVETCVCNKGFVLSAGKCVPADTCGCSYQGRYYKPRERFWADDGCTQLCECDPALGMVVCRESACKSNERCVVEGSSRACKPVSYATCSGSGDPHYRTFDGRRFDFQGTCVYQLVALCSKDADLVPFKVTVQNNHRGSKSVSFTKVVTVEVYGITITVSKDYPFKILVDGQFLSLPFYLNDNEVVVQRSGWTAVIDTAFGMRVTFNWNSEVEVTLPSTYEGMVCGLCGNYNKNPGDDNIMRDGKPAPGDTQLGDSWQVGVVQGCSPSCSGDHCQVCTNAQMETYKGQRYCGVIGDKAGPLRECHARVDPAAFLQNCVFDACYYKGHHTAVCEAVAAYASACEKEGVAIQPWRSATFCPPICPKNSHYEARTTGCPATCATVGAAGRCQLPLREGCQCDDGFVLSGDACVPVAECGCSYGGRYYKKCEVFYPGGKCEEKCKCGENGVVSCQKFQCGAGEVCKVSNGVQGCHPAGESKCVASGDPHYISFDGHRFDFQGTCVYVLAKLCEGNRQLVPFTVEEGNEKYGNGKVAVTKSVAVAVYGVVVTIKQGMRWKVMVDGELMNLPLSLDEGRITVNQEGSNIVVQTDFGLRVLYDAVYYVEVVVPSTYQGKMCGLCGNYNGNGGDDYRLPDGGQTTNVDDFGRSWAVDMAKGECAGCRGDCPVCPQAEAARHGKPDSCGIISAAGGPFQACHAKVNPDPYFKHCVFDVCALGGDTATLCKSVQAYAIACQDAGVEIRSWRSASFCPATCPANSHYELCADTCGTTCASLAGPTTCSKACFEGCQCDDGFVSDGDKCVSMDSCGCLYEGRYLKAGERVVNKGCNFACECHSSGVVVCEKVECANGEECGLRDGVLGCHPKQGICTVKPGAQLTSFDGMKGEAAGPGAYHIAALCDLSSAQWFRVVADVRACEKGGQASVAAVYVFFKGAVVAVNKEQQAWVNGQKVSLPSKLENEVSISVSDSVVVVEKSSVVRVSYSLTLGVKVTIDTPLAGRVCGACGNYNGDAKDDMTTAGGTVSGSVSDVISSWQAGDFSTCGL